MNLKFKNFKILQRINSGQTYSYAEVDVKDVIDTLLKEYKEQRMVSEEYEPVKKSEFNEEEYLRNQPDVLPEYYWIYRDVTTTPHGTHERITYRGDAEEQDYKVYKALTTIQKLLENGKN